MAKTPARQRFTLVLEDVGGVNDPPAVHRLRVFLKAAWRAYRLRCLSAREDEQQPAPAEEARP